MCTPFRQQFCRQRNMHTIILDQFKCQNRPGCGARRQSPIDASYISEDEWDFIRSFSGEMFKNYLLMRQLQNKSGFSTKMVRWLLQEDFDEPMIKKNVHAKSGRKAMKKKNFLKKLPSVPFTNVFDCWERNNADVVHTQWGGCVGGASEQRNFVENGYTCPITETRTPYAAPGTDGVLMRHGGLRFCDGAGRCSTDPRYAPFMAAGRGVYADDGEAQINYAQDLRLQRALAAHTDGAFNGKLRVAEEFRKIFGRNEFGAFGAQGFNGPQMSYPEFFGMQSAPAGHLTPLQILRLGGKALATYMAGVSPGAAGDFAITKPIKYPNGFVNYRDTLNRMETIGDYRKNRIPRYSGDYRFGKDVLRRRAFETADVYGRIGAARYMDPRKGFQSLNARQSFENIQGYDQFSARHLDPRQGCETVDVRHKERGKDFETAKVYGRNGDARDWETRKGFETVDIYDRTGTATLMDPHQNTPFQAAGGYGQTCSPRYMESRQCSETADVNRRVDDVRHRHMKPRDGDVYVRTEDVRHMEPRQGLETSDVYGRVGDARYLHMDPRQGLEIGDVYGHTEDARHMEPCLGFETGRTGDARHMEPSQGFETADTYRRVGDTGRRYMDPRQGFEIADVYGRTGDARHMEPRQGFETADVYGRVGGTRHRYMDARKGLEIGDVYGRTEDARHMEPRQGFETADVYPRTGDARHMEPRQDFETADVYGRVGDARHIHMDPRQRYIDPHQGKPIETIGGYGRISSTREINFRQGGAFQSSDGYDRIGSARYMNARQFDEPPLGYAPLGTYKLPDTPTHNRDPEYVGQAEGTTNENVLKNINGFTAGDVRRAYKHPDWKQLMADERLKLKNVKKSNSLNADEFDTLVQQLDSFYSEINMTPQSEPLHEIPSGDTELNLTAIVDFLKQQNTTPFYPVAYHEPFDRSKPWTWMQTFPIEIPQKYLDRVSEHSLAALQAWQRLQALMVQKNEQPTMEKFTNDGVLTLRTRRRTSNEKERSSKGEQLLE